MAFDSPVITNAGLNLFAQALDGETITFTSIKMGSGYLGGTPIEEMTALVTPVITLPLSSISRGDNYATIVAMFSNVVYESFVSDGAAVSYTLRAAPVGIGSVKIGGVETDAYTYTSSSGVLVLSAAPASGTVIDVSYHLAAFNWREIGVFAADPDFPNDRSRDILYCYQNAGDAPFPIPAPDPVPYTERISVSIHVGQAETVTIIVSPAMQSTDVEFDPGETGMAATNVQDAIREVYLIAGAAVTQAALNAALANKANANHVHGNLSNAGTLSATAVGTPGVDIMNPVFTGADGKLGTLSPSDARTALGVPVISNASASLPAANWSAGEPAMQTVSVTGVTSTANVIVAGDPSDAAAYTAWLEAGVYCSAQGSGTLTFSAPAAPEVDLTANILIVEVRS